MTFTASNGVQVQVFSNGRGNVGPVELKNRGHKASTTAYFEPEAIVALREFFRHEADKELGRWRDPANPTLTVYPTPGFEDDEITILDEVDAEAYTITRAASARHSAGWWRATAHAYFESHPEPEPWEDAKDGHLWLIRFDDFPNTDVSALVKGGRFIYNDHCHEGVAELTDPTIVAGRRIWPESD
jgi:hypothetical protein